MNDQNLGNTKRIQMVWKNMDFMAHTTWQEL